MAKVFDIAARSSVARRARQGDELTVETVAEADVASSCRAPAPNVQTARRSMAGPSSDEASRITIVLVGRDGTVEGLPSFD
jgi:hypothetical protein